MNTNFSRILRKSNQLHFLWVFVMAQAVFVPSAMPATITDLGTLGGSLTEPLAINNAGQVVGYSTTAAGYDEAFVYSGGVMTALTTYSSGGTGTFNTYHSEATGINNAGQITGYFATSAGGFHSFLYSGGVMQDLGNLGGTYEDGGVNEAAAINDAGQITGWEYSQAANSQAVFIYSGGKTTTFVPSCGLGYTCTIYPLAINNAGQVVGRALNLTVLDSSPGAFLYSNGTVTDLLGGRPASRTISMTAARSSVIRLIIIPHFCTPAE